MRSGYVNCDMGQLHYWTAGKGPNLVLLHQSTQSSEEYLGLIPYLEENYTMWAIEWLGHGNSCDPAHEPEMDDYTRTVSQALDALDIKKAAFLGHHGGGSICIDIAASQPDRATHVIASGTGQRSKEETEKLLKHRKEVPEPINEKGDFLNKMWSIYAKLGGPETSLEIMHRVFLVNMKERLRRYDAHDPILKWNKAEACSKLRCPVLLMQGDLDNFVTGQEDLLKTLDSGQRKVIKDVGAFLFYEKPEEISKAVHDFISNS
ncbi:MAG: alpha/beta fold hydrolase [Rhodospirillaceae bacterium]